MENVFDQVKTALNIQEVICRETSLAMKGKHLEECPFCGGHGCFSIQAENGRFKCFQCAEGGSVIDFLMKHLGIDEAGALQRGAAMAGITLDKPASAPRLTVVDKILQQAAEYYHQNIQNGARAYLIEKRGHRDDVLKKMMVGFSDGDLVNHLAKQKFSYDDMLKSGLVRMDAENGKTIRYYDFFSKNLVIFPHVCGKKIFHFSSKDPSGKKPPYQLPADFRHKQWFFYNQDALKYDGGILVEGENDLLSVLEAGFFNVFGLIGQISDVQIKRLERYCKTNTLYLWMDNDYDPEKPFAKGLGYVRKICQAIDTDNIKIIVYPDQVKDPDDFIQAIKDPKERKKTVDALIGASVDYITWEIGQAARMEDKAKIISHLEKFGIFQRITRQPEIWQPVYVDRIEALGFPRKAIEAKLETEHDLKQKLALYFEAVGNKGAADPIVISNMMFEFFKKEGKFYRTREDEVFLLYKNRTYSISNNLPFNALIMKTAKPSANPGAGEERLERSGEPGF